MADTQSDQVDAVDGADNTLGKSKSNFSGSRLLVIVLALCLIPAIVYRVYYVKADAKTTSQPNPTDDPSIDFENMREQEIFGGGPAKDGIPAISNPQFLKAEHATHLKPEDRVIAVQIGKTKRVYPIKILNYHEIVNDKIGEIPIAVTYCPLCDSAVVFDRRLKAGVREFGVSGLLYNSNVLMYARGKKPHKLWSQIMTERFTGEGKYEKLKTLPMELTTWKSWKTRHPESVVLSNQTGYTRDYNHSHYASYFKTDELFFDVALTDERLLNKVPVLGVWTEKSAIAFPIERFKEGDEPLQETIDGISFTVIYDHEAKSLRIENAGKGIQYAYSLWFAWYAFHTNTEIYSPEIIVNKPQNK